MRVLRKFWGLSGPKKTMILVSWVSVFTVRVGLWCLPFRTLLRIITFLTRVRPTERPTEVSAQDLAWAVKAASRYVPKPTCLTQAMALNVLLARRGHAGDIKIGVAKDPDGGLKSHAWVEHDGRIILGEVEDIGDFTTLTSLHEAAHLVDRHLSS